MRTGGATWKFLQYNSDNYLMLSPSYSAPGYAASLYLGKAPLALFSTRRRRTTPEGLFRIRTQ